MRLAPAEVIQSICTLCMFKSSVIVVYDQICGCWLPRTTLILSLEGRLRVTLVAIYVQMYDNW